LAATESADTTVARPLLAWQALRVATNIQATNRMRCESCIVENRAAL